MAITERVILSVSGGVEEWKDDLKVMLQTLKAQDGYLRTRYASFAIIHSYRISN